MTDPRDNRLTPQAFGRAQWLAVAALLLLMAVQGSAAIRRLSVTWDEPAYLVTGYAQLRTGAMDLGAASNPPLMKYLIGAPLFFRRVTISFDSELFRTGNDYDYGLQVLFGSGNDWRAIVSQGRHMVLLLSLVLACYVYLWARALFGVRAALFALLLYACDPNVLAHATLATTDFGLAAFMFMSAYHAWRFCKTGRTAPMVLAGVFLGCALGTKTTGILLAPLLPLMAWLCAAPADGPAAASSAARRWRGVALIFLLALLSLWAIYGFTVGRLGPPENNFVGGNPGASIAARQLMRERFGWLQDVPLPAVSWVKTLIWQAGHARAGHEAYLLGETSRQGWWYYFLVAYAIKTPLPVLASLAVGAFCTLRAREGRADRVALLLVPAAFFSWSTVSRVDIGIRHILPVIPFLAVFAAQAVAAAATPPRWRTAAASLAAVWLAGGCLFIFPDYLAYFNELIGGPANGHKYLVDSNLDWGQGLIQVRDYIDRNRLGAVKFSYFGSVPPAVYGVVQAPISWAERMEPQRDLYLISVTNLYDVYATGQGLPWARSRRPTGRIGRSVFVYDLRGG